MISYTKIVQLGASRYRYEWEDTEDFYSIYYNGTLLEIIDVNYYESDLDNIVVNDINPPPFAIIQWWPVPGSSYYRVEYYNGTEWVQHKVVNESQKPYYSVKSKIHEDNSLVKYRVVAIDDIEEETIGEEIELRIICAPSYTFAEGDIS